MSTLHRLTKLGGKLIDIVPRTIIRTMPRRYHNLTVSKLSTPKNFRWIDAQIPDKLEGFEDLTFLFWASPLNRGILRQDFDEAAALYKTVRQMDKPRGVEIGRLKGGSTVMLAVAVGEGGHLLSIDIMPQSDNKVRQVLENAGLSERVELVVADANTVERDGDFDFAFIDGDHSYEGARRDHNRWGRQVKVGGYIIHHDMAKQRPLATQWHDLQQLRAAILEKQSGELELAREAGSMCLFRRVSETWTDV